MVLLHPLYPYLDVNISTKNKASDMLKPMITTPKAVKTVPNDNGCPLKVPIEIEFIQENFIDCFAKLSENYHTDLISGHI